MFRNMNILQGFIDATKCIMQDWKSYLIYMVLQATILFIYIRKVIEHTTDLDFLQYRSFIGTSGFMYIILMSLVAYFLMMLIQVDMIKTTSDLKDKKEHQMLYRIGFTIGKSPKLLGVWILMILPIVALLYIMSQFITSISAVIALVVLVILYIVFLSFINHGIIISAASIFETIEESILIVKSNLPHYLLTVVVLGAIVVVVNMIFSSNDIFTLLIKSTLNAVTYVIGVTWMTVLYKQAQPYDENL